MKMMEQNKKELLMEQVDKINEVISTLSENFVQEDIADEVNFLSVVSSNLKDWGAAREGRNPATGKTIKIPAKKAPKFTAGKALKDAAEKAKAKK